MSSTRVVVTARCSFCARKFTPATRPDGKLNLGVDDNGGRLCCDECTHDTCWHGHVTDCKGHGFECFHASGLCDRHECETEHAFPAGEMDAYDHAKWGDSFAALALVQG